MLQPDHTAVIKLLRESPLRIQSLAAGRTDQQLARKPDADTWSASEVLAHLRACADVWGRNIATILTQDQPTFRHVSPRSWIRKTNYSDLNFGESFAAFTAQRKELLRVLRALSDADWNRSATVRMPTGSRTQTVLSYAQLLANHEAGHWEQIARVLNSI